MTKATNMSSPPKLGRSWYQQTNHWSFFGGDIRLRLMSLGLERLESIG